MGWGARAPTDAAVMSVWVSKSSSPAIGGPCPWHHLHPSISPLPPAAHSFIPPRVLMTEREGLAYWQTPHISGLQPSWDKGSISFLASRNPPKNGHVWGGCLDAEEGAGPPALPALRHFLRLCAASLPRDHGRHLRSWRALLQVAGLSVVSPGEQPLAVSWARSPHPAPALRPSPLGFTAPRKGWVSGSTRDPA